MQIRENYLIRSESFYNLVGGYFGASTLRLQTFMSLTAGSNELHAFMCEI